MMAVKPPREPMPRFQAKSLDGEVFTRENLKGKVVLVQHWATWCGYCRKDEPAVEQVIRDHAKDGLVVLTPDPDKIKALHIVDNVFPKHSITYKVCSSREFKAMIKAFHDPSVSVLRSACPLDTPKYL